jgi:hypothetical protein
METQPIPSPALTRAVPRASGDSRRQPQGRRDAFQSALEGGAQRQDGGWPAGPPEPEPPAALPLQSTPAPGRSTEDGGDRHVDLLV